MITSLKYEILTEEIRLARIKLAIERRKLENIKIDVRRKRNGFNEHTTRSNNQKQSITNGTF